MNAEPLIVRHSADAIAFCERLVNESVVGIDTEFHRENSYFGHLLLVQIATSREVVLLDPVDSALRPDDLRRVLTTLRDNDILVAGHALKNDLELFLQVVDVLPARVFDTQIAASFLGGGAQVGLKELVSRQLGVELDKGHAHADWSRRPLPARQLAYAVADVEHLLPLVAGLQVELERRGRLSWVEEECARALDPLALAPTAPAEAWTKVKKKPREGSAACHVLKELAAERERIAAEKDVPRARILPDDILVDLASRAPTDEGGLRNDASRRQHGGLDRFGARWLAAIRRAAERPMEPRPSGGRAARGRPLTGPQNDLLDLMRLLVARRADDEGLAAKLLVAPLRDRLPDVVQTPPADRAAMEAQLGLSGWRAELIGETLWALLSGALCATCAHQDGALELHWK